MAGFSIMLMNFILIPLIILSVLLWVAGVFALGGLAAGAVILMIRRAAGRPHRMLYIRTGNAAATAQLLRGAGVREQQLFRSEAAPSVLIKARITAKINLEALMAQIAAAGVQGMYVFNA